MGLEPPLDTAMAAAVVVATAAAAELVSDRESSWTLKLSQAALLSCGEECSFELPLELLEDCRLSLPSDTCCTEGGILATTS